MTKLIKVSANSRTASVAGAIAGILRENASVNVQAIGADAVNQSVKAAALARRFLAEEGLKVMVVPSFTEVQIEERERTAVRLSIYVLPAVQGI